jgi:hypothetical protein
MIIESRNKRDGDLGKAETLQEAILAWQMDLVDELLSGKWEISNSFMSSKTKLMENFSNPFLDDISKTTYDSIFSVPRNTIHDNFIIPWDLSRFRINTPILKLSDEEKDDLLKQYENEDILKAIPSFDDFTKKMSNFPELYDNFSGQMITPKSKSMYKYHLENLAKWWWRHFGYYEKSVEFLKKYPTFNEYFNQQLYEQVLIPGIKELHHSIKWNYENYPYRKSLDAFWNTKSLENLLYSTKSYKTALNKCFEEKFDEQYEMMKKKWEFKLYEINMLTNIIKDIKALWVINTSKYEKIIEDIEKDKEITRVKFNKVIPINWLEGINVEFASWESPDILLFKMDEDMRIQFNKLKKWDEIDIYLNEWPEESPGWSWVLSDLRWKIKRIIPK